MSNPFKIGDRVICIDECLPQLTEGETYTVTSRSLDFVGFSGDDLPDWLWDRFILAKDTKETPETETGCFIVAARDSSGTSTGGCVIGQYQTLVEATKHAEDAAFDTSLDFIVFKAVKGITRSTREFSV